MGTAQIDGLADSGGEADESQALIKALGGAWSAVRGRRCEGEERLSRTDEKEKRRG